MITVQGKRPNRGGKSRFIIFAAAMFLATTMFYGCLTSVPIPSVTFSKFVRDPEVGESRGKIGFSTGASIQKRSEADEDTPEESLICFPLEGSVTGWIGESYDLAVSATSGLNMGGNLALVSGDKFRLGILHGISISMGSWEFVYWKDQFVNLSIGAFAQYGVRDIGVLFLGGTYSANMYEKHQNEHEGAAQYLNGSLGYMFTAGRFRITPEIVLSYGFWEGEYGRQEDVWIIFPMITFAAVF